MRTLGWLGIWAGLALALAGGSDSPRAEPAAGASRIAAKPAISGTANDSTKAPHNATFRGRVVWLADGLRELHGIRQDDDAAQAMAALQTGDGRLLPLVKDARGRGFWLDERLRDIDVELYAREFPGTPWIQVIRVYTIHDGQTFELDYWCDICAIPMFELKACECCQGETRLRERRPDGNER